MPAYNGPRVLVELSAGEGIVDGGDRTVSLLRRKVHPAIIHCDNCGCDWLDNGLNPVGCPYCKLPREAERRWDGKMTDILRDTQER